MEVRKNFIRQRLRTQDWRQLPAELGYQARRLGEQWEVPSLTLWRAFREVFRISPQRLLNEFRDLKARELARGGVRKKEIVQLLGYKHAAHLSRRLRQGAWHALELLGRDASGFAGDIHNSESQS